MPALTFGRGRMSKIEKSLVSAKKSLANFKDKYDDKIEYAIHGFEVTGAAFGMAALSARYGGITLFGFRNAEWMIGGALHALGFWEVGGKNTAGHLHALGDGVLAAWAAGLGTTVGQEWAARAGEGGVPVGPPPP